jgi:L-ascorbate metabolism protein UlaG (beta-lactamase superfamily)
MQLFWHGYSSIRIESKNGDQASTLVTDPFENEASVRFPRTIESDIVLLSNEDRAKFNLEALNGNPFIISDPGEYEARGVFVDAIRDPEVGDRCIAYRIMTEGMSVAFLGLINRKLTNAEMERLENIDILLLPVGGGEGMSPTMAADLISEVEPRIVVPIHFSIPGIKAELGSIDTFCKHLGACQKEEMNRLKIQKKDLPVDTMMVAVLERA